MNAINTKPETALGTALVNAGLKTEASKAMPRLHGNGAKSKKVAAKPVGNGTLKDFAETEASLILETGMARMAHWVKIGNAYVTQPELLKQYPDALRNALYAKVKLPIPTALAPKSQWTDEKAIKLANALDVEVSQCRRAMSALATQFATTVKLLSGKGTYQDKIKQLPVTSNKGRKARQTTAGPDGGTESGTETTTPAKKENPTLTTLAAIVGAVRTINENEIAKIMQACAVRCKDSKLAVMNRLATDVFKALDEFDGTAQAARSTQQKTA